MDDRFKPESVIGMGQYMQVQVAKVSNNRDIDLDQCPIRNFIIVSAHRLQDKQ
jgi:hypothetical protein